MYFTANAGNGYHIWRQSFPDGRPQQVTAGATQEEGIAFAPDGHSFVTAIGQSLGGSVLAGLIASGRLPVERLIFCAPALGQMRAKLLPDQLRQLRVHMAADMELAAVGLADEDYTDIPRYLDFMRKDPLMLRTITRRSRVTFLALEDFYFGGRTPWPNVPVNLIIPSHDPIIRLTAAQKTLEAISARRPEITQFSTTLHYIEFSNERERYWDLLAQLVASPRLEVVQ